MHVYNSYTREWIEAKQILSSSLRGERKVGRERERDTGDKKRKTCK